MARLLAEAGWLLGLSGRRVEVLESMTASLPGNRVRALACELPEGAAGLAQLAAEFSGAELALVNLVGSAHFGDFSGTPVETAYEQVQSNLAAVIGACHALLPAMLSAGRGRIVNVLSIAATHSFSGAAAYCGAKAGALAFSRALALEVRSRGVLVTCLLPGSTNTPLWDRQSGSPARGDMLTPEAVAEVIVQLLDTPADRCVDELVLTPPKGVL